MEDLRGSYSVTKVGAVTGAGEITDFDRTGNTYGMEAWVNVGAAEGFARLVTPP